jgi:hypothetical protein
LDLLQVLTARFKLEMGRQFDRMWEDCLDGLGNVAAQLFQGVNPDKESLDLNVHVVKSRYKGLEKEEDAGLLLDAFAELVRLVTDSAQKYLGKGIVDEAVGEGIKILALVEKYQQDPELADGFRRLLKNQK